MAKVNGLFAIREVIKTNCFLIIKQLQLLRIITKRSFVIIIEEYLKIMQT